MTDTQLTCRRCGTSYSSGIITELLAKMRKSISVAEPDKETFSDEEIWVTQQLAFLALGLGCAECELGTNAIITIGPQEKMRHAIDLIEFLLPEQHDLLQFQIALSQLMQARCEQRSDGGREEKSRTKDP